MILTLNGKPIAILTGVSENNVEETLRSIRRARATSAVNSMQKNASTSGASKLTVKEIEAEIQTARKRIS